MASCVSSLGVVLFSLLAAREMQIGINIKYSIAKEIFPLLLSKLEAVTKSPKIKSSPRMSGD